MPKENMPEDTYQPMSKASASSKAVMILTADKVEDLEFFYPFYRFVEEGFKVDVITPDGGKFEGKHGLGLKESKKISEVIPSDYDLLYIPGGKAPEKLKKEEEVIAFVKAFAESGKPISAVCHGPQVLAEAGVIRGKKIAAWPQVREEVEEAGAFFQDAETIIDGQFITARWPADLPSHVAKTLQLLKAQAQSAANRNTATQFAA